MPLTPVLTISQLTTSGCNALTFTSLGLTDRFLLYRSTRGEVVCLTRTLEESQPYTDFNVQSGVAYYYYGFAMDGDGLLSDVSNMETATLSLTSTLLHKVARKSNTNNADANNNVLALFNQEGSNREITVAS
jgi:hypothetical protein